MNKQILSEGDCSKWSEMDELIGKQFDAFTVIQLLDDNALRPDLPRNMNTHTAIHRLLVTPYVKQPENTAPAGAERPAPVSIIARVEHFADNILSNRK